MAVMVRLAGVADKQDERDDAELASVDAEPAVIAVLSDDEFRRLCARITARELIAEAA